MLFNHGIEWTKNIGILQFAVYAQYLVLWLAPEILTGNFQMTRPKSNNLFDCFKLGYQANFA
jgi:hypothetical protein